MSKEKDLYGMPGNHGYICNDDDPYGDMTNEEIAIYENGYVTPTYMSINDSCED